MSIGSPLGEMSASGGQRGTKKEELMVNGKWKIVSSLNNSNNK